jgi:imidazolonepropionase-like amidohydrolase
LNDAHVDQIARRKIWTTVRNACIMKSRHFEIVDMKGKLGTIAARAIADILVLDGDPLADINVIAGEGERVAYVLQRGKIVKTGDSAH